MASDRTVKVSFIGDASSLNRASAAASASLAKVGDQVKAAGDHVTSGVSRIGSAVGSFAKVAGVGLLAGTAGLAAFGKGAVNAASGLAESLGKSNVVFGEQAKEIEAWAGTASRAFGQSKQQALEAAGTYGNLFQAFGVGRTESAKMSTSLVELAADLASFNNTSVDDALEALRSGLSGETEPLKKFGVALSDDRLKTEALRLGLIKSVKDGLTPAAKAQASYSLIMKDTALAQGDFARTSDGLANRTRILKARFADIQAEIGTKLLPIVVSLAGFVLDRVLPAFEKLGSGVGRALREIRSGFKEGVNSEGFVGALQRLGDIARTVFEGGVKFVSAFFDAFKRGGDDVNSSGVAGFFERVGLVARSVFEWLKENGPAILSALKDAGEKALSFLGTAFEKIADVVKNTIYPAIKNVVEFMLRHKETLVGIAVAIGVAFAVWAVNAASAAIATAAAAAPFVAIALAIGAAVAALIYAYKHWEGFRNAVDATGRFLKNSLLPALKDVGSWIKDVLVPAIADAARWIAEKLGPSFKAVGEFIKNTVIPAVAKFVDFMATKVAPVVAKVVEAFVKFSVKVAEVVGKVLKTVLPVLIKLNEIFLKVQLAVAKFAIEFVTAVAGVVVKAVELGVKVGKAVADVVKWLIDFGKKAFDLGKSVAETVGNIIAKFVEVAKTVGEKVGEIIGFFVGLPGRIADGAGDLFGFIKDKISDAKDWVGDRVGDIIGFVTGIPGKIASGAQDLFYDIKFAATTAKNWAEDKFDALIGFIAGLPGRIGRAAVGMFDGLKDAFRSAINFIIDGWNSIEFTLPGIDTHIPGVGKIGGFTLGTPDIPRLAEGGIVSKATLALIGERGPEAVVPLSRGGGFGSKTIVVDMRGAHITGVTDFKRAVKEAVIAGSKADGGWHVSLRNAS